MDHTTTPAVGYLVVQVTTANSAIPLSDATVTVTSNSGESADVLFELRTGKGGRTERITLPTLPRTESERPQTTRPYLTYNIEVRADGFETAIYQNVAVFEGITAFQQANLVPLPSNGYPDGYTLGNPQIYQNTEPNL